MRSRIRFIGYTAFIILSLSATHAIAENASGRILKVQGSVNIINEKGEIRKVESSNMPVHEQETVVTDDGSKAVVQYTDGALSILGEKSSLKVEKGNWLSHLGGKIYFTFRKIFGAPKKVKFKNATIGIRGTTFIVTDDETGGGVALQEGLLNIESPGDAFEIHKKRPMTEYEAFKHEAMMSRKQMMDEFAGYKKQLMKEFVEYKKSFTLQPNKVIRFDGNRVDESDMGESVKAEFSDFESVAGDMLKEFREKAKAHREKMEQEQKKQNNDDF